MVRLIREDIFKEKDGQVRLIGGQCPKCGSVSFPKGAFCTECLCEELEDKELSKTGTLYSWTISRMKSGNWEPPYALGLIDLPEGVRVVSPLVGEELHVGDEMEMEFAPLWMEEDGTVVSGYKFQKKEAQK